MKTTIVLGPDEGTSVVSETKHLEMNLIEADAGVERGCAAALLDEQIDSPMYTTLLEDNLANENMMQISWWGFLDAK